LKHFAYKLLLVISMMTLCLIGLDWILETSEIAEGLFGWKLGRFSWPGLRTVEPLWVRHGIGATAFLLPILAAAAGVLAARDTSITTQTRDGGLIRLAPRAIEKVARREIRQNVDDILAVNVMARQGKKQAPALTIHIGVTDRRPVPEVEAKVRAEAERLLRHLLGVADTKQIKVIVHDVAPASKKRRSKATARDSSLPVGVSPRADKSAAVAGKLE